jgi:nucleoside-diphosphate-sugar epimerase
MLNGKRIVVTGASGFLGSHIAKALIDANAHVVAAVRSPDKARFLGPVELVRADLTEPESLVAAFSRADAIISNAALGSNQGSMEDFERVNCRGVSDLMEASHAAGVRRVIHISSVAVYRTRLFAAMDESTTPYDTAKRRFNWSDFTTDWRYARTKTLAENLAWDMALRHGLELTALRPGPIYGSRDPKATARLIGKLRTSRLLPTPTVGVPWVHAGDVAQAVVASLVKPSSIGRAYNLAGPPISQYGFMKALRKALDAHLERPRLARLMPIPVPLSVCYDTTAASRDLGFSPRALADGLAEAVSLESPG